MDQLRVLVFDVKGETVAALRQAFPDWDIETTVGATMRSLSRNWNPGPSDLLVVGQHDEVAETLRLCRALRSQAGQAHTPLLVLVQPAAESLVRAALEAGADSCLVLPVHEKDLVAMLARARRGNQPGRHTLGLHPAQFRDPWQDDGGEA